MVVKEAVGPSLQSYLIDEIPRACDQDPEILAEYVQALLSREEDPGTLKRTCLKELRDFVGSSTDEFVEGMFDFLHREKAIVDPTVQGGTRIEDTADNQAAETTTGEDAKEEQEDVVEMRPAEEEGGQKEEEEEQEEEVAPTRDTHSNDPNTTMYDGCHDEAATGSGDRSGHLYGDSSEEEEEEDDDDDLFGRDKADDDSSSTNAPSLDKNGVTTSAANQSRHRSGVQQGPTRGRGSRNDAQRGGVNRIPLQPAGRGSNFRPPLQKRPPFNALHQTNGLRQLVPGGAVLGAARQPLLRPSRRPAGFPPFPHHRQQHPPPPLQGGAMAPRNPLLLRPGERLGNAGNARHGPHPNSNMHLLNRPPHPSRPPPVTNREFRPPPEQMPPQNNQHHHSRGMMPPSRMSGGKTAAPRHQHPQPHQQHQGQDQLKNGWWRGYLNGFLFTCTNVRK
eukprot:jgi/Bigna1/134720/aug1.26_g9428